jgi:integrase/recombinase XerD
MNILRKQKLAALFEGSSGKGPLDRAPGCGGGATATEDTPTVPGTAVVKDGMRPAIFAATAKVYVRHGAGCPHGDDKHFRHCRCPKWIYENYDGTDRRYSAETQSWSEAENLRQDIEDSHDPVIAELKKLKETQQAKRIPISDAVEYYLSDVAARHLARSTQGKCRLTVGKRLRPWSEENGLRYLDELTVPQLTKFRSTWTLSPRSSQNEQKRVTTFFEFCVRQGFLERNPARLLNRIQVRRIPTDYFPREEFERLVAATYLLVRRRSSKNADKAIWPTLMRTMVLVMRWSGLRIGDSVNLERTRLVGDKILLYQHKTGQPVYVPLPREVAESLREVPPLGNTPTPRFFFRKDHRTERSALDCWHRAFRRLFQIANIRKPDGTPKRCYPICCGTHLQ